MSAKSGAKKESAIFVYDSTTLGLGNALDRPEVVNNVLELLPTLRKPEGDMFEDDFISMDPVGVGPALAEPAEDFIPMGMLEEAAAAGRTGAEPLVAEAAGTAGREIRMEGLPPWMPPATHPLPPPVSHLAALHNEIVRFNRFLKPTPEEDEIRGAAVSRVRTIIQGLWSRGRVEVFGSFATGLHLPTSDVDLVVMDSGAENVANALRALAAKLSRHNIAQSLQVIAKARVPIVKFVERESGINFDVSFDQPTGPRAAGYVKDLLTTVPHLRPLMLVLKVFLQQRDLNEVYSGGVGSYGLLGMLAGFLLSHPSRKVNSAEGPDPNLGTLLLDFLLFYGRVLNQSDVGVSVKHGGSFFSKHSKGWFLNERPNVLAIEDPQDAENDVTRNSHAFPRVRAAFEHAFQLLSLPLEVRGDSLLMRVLRWDDVLISRPGVERRTAAELEEEAREAGVQAAAAGARVGDPRRRGREAVPSPQPSQDSGRQQRGKDKEDRGREREKEKDRERDREKERGSNGKGSGKRDRAAVSEEGGGGAGGRKRPLEEGEVDLDPEARGRGRGDREKEREDDRGRARVASWQASRDEERAQRQGEDRRGAERERDRRRDGGAAAAARPRDPVPDPAAEARGKGRRGGGSESRSLIRHRGTDDAPPRKRPRWEVAEEAPAPPAGGRNQPPPPKKQPPLSRRVELVQSPLPPAAPPRMPPPPAPPQPQNHAAANGAAANFNWQPPSHYVQAQAVAPPPQQVQPVYYIGIPQPQQPVQYQMAQVAYVQQMQPQPPAPHQQQPRAPAPPPNRGGAGSNGAQAGPRRGGIYAQQAPQQMPPPAPPQGQPPVYNQRNQRPVGGGYGRW